MFGEPGPGLVGVPLLESHVVVPKSPFARAFKGCIASMLLKLLRVGAKS